MKPYDSRGAASVIAEPVIVSVDESGDYVLVIPRDLAEAQLTTYRTLATARTFGELQADPAAAMTAALSQDQYLERLNEILEADDETQDDDAFAARHTGPVALFDAETFFPDDRWRPDPKQTTADWLTQNEPDLVHLLEEDEEAVVYSANPPRIVRSDVVGDVELALTGAGRLVLRVDGLLDDVYERCDVAAIRRRNPCRDSSGAGN